MKVIDKEYTIEVGNFCLEIASFEFDGIGVTISGLGKSFQVRIYDELNEKFTPEYHTLCQVLDAFIVEQLEDRVRRCFVK